MQEEEDRPSLSLSDDSDLISGLLSKLKHQDGYIKLDEVLDEEEYRANPFNTQQNRELAALRANPFNRNTHLRNQPPPKLSLRDLVKGDDLKT